MIIVTGGSGFIGSYIVDSLVGENDVLVIDKKTGFTNPRAKYVNADICDAKDMTKLTKGAEIIFHFAADPNVRESAEKPMASFDVNVVGTVNMLEAARTNDVRKFIFASSSTIYGNAKIPTKETEPAFPISPYGASKASCDAFLSAYVDAYGIDGVSCVYGNIFGPRSDHGVMYDFYHKLLRDPNKLMILGNGKQQKSYLYITDTIDATLLCSDKAKGYNKYNISSDEWINVEKIARVICDEMKISPVLNYTGGKSGWVGDVPKFKLDISKIRKLGWKPKVSTEDGIRRYINYLKESS